MLFLNGLCKRFRDILLLCSVEFQLYGTGACFNYAPLWISVVYILLNMQVCIHQLSMGRKGGEKVPIDDFEVDTQICKEPYINQ